MNRFLSETLLHFHSFKFQYSQAEIKHIISPHMIFDCANIVSQYATPRMEEIVNHYLKQLRHLAAAKLENLRHEEIRALASASHEGVEHINDGVTCGIYVQNQCIASKFEIDALLHRMYMELRQLSSKWPLLREELLS